MKNFFKLLFVYFVSNISIQAIIVVTAMLASIGAAGLPNPNPVTVFERCEPYKISGVGGDQYAVSMRCGGKEKKMSSCKSLSSLELYSSITAELGETSNLAYNSFGKSTLDAFLGGDTCKVCHINFFNVEEVKFDKSFISLIILSLKKSNYLLNVKVESEKLKSFDYSSGFSERLFIGSPERPMSLSDMANSIDSVITSFYQEREQNADLFESGFNYAQSFKDSLEKEFSVKSCSRDAEMFRKLSKIRLRNFNKIKTIGKLGGLKPPGAELPGAAGIGARIRGP
jgi:hypothetical protein